MKSKFSFGGIFDRVDLSVMFIKFYYFDGNLFYYVDRFLLEWWSLVDIIFRSISSSVLLGLDLFFMVCRGLLVVSGYVEISNLGFLKFDEVFALIIK